MPRPILLGLFTVGLLAGGMLTATCLWLLSGLARPVPTIAAWALVTALGLVAVARDLGLLRIRLPQNARQIPREVLWRRPMSGAARFGFELGTGVRTYLSASAPYLMAITVLLVGPGLSAALLTGAGFGLGRAVTTWIRLAAPDPARWDDRLGAQSRPIAVTAAVAITTLAGVSALAMSAL